MLYLFPDTNSFIHYQFILEIHFNQFLEADEFKVILMPQILSEIDKHKYSDRPKLRKRAQSVIKKLEPILLSKNSDTILSSANLNMSTDDFKLNGYDINDSDDVFLYSVICFLDSKGVEKSKSLIITSDLGLKMKCKSRDIPFSSLPNKYQSPLERDQTEIENDKLKLELRSLKNKQPYISASFINNEQELIVSESYSEIMDIESWVNNEMQKFRKELPKYSHRGFPLTERNIKIDELTSSGVSSISNLFKPSKESIEEYNNSLDRYFDNYEKSLEAIYINQMYKNHSIALNIIVKNTGSEPSLNTDLVLKSSQDIYLMHPDLLPNIPDLPNPPKKPTSSLTLGTITSTYHGMSNVLKNFSPPDIIEPTIELIDRRHLKIRLGKIKHNSSKNIGPIYLRYGYKNNLSDVKLNCSITCDNLPNEIRNTLFVKKK